MTKKDYSTSVRKRMIQQLVLSQVKKHRFKNLVGLGGPNITAYLRMFAQAGIRAAQIYERERTQLLLQLQDFIPVLKTRVCMEDIYHANPDLKGTFYDLDFCCSIHTAADHIQKFKNNAVFTLSLRPIGLSETISTFCRLVSKQKPKVKYNVEKTANYRVHRIDFTDKSYLCYQYQDTCPMLTIQPLTFKS